MQIFQTLFSIFFNAGNRSSTMTGHANLSYEL